MVPTCSQDYGKNNIVTLLGLKHGWGTGKAQHATSIA